MKQSTILFLLCATFQLSADPILTFFFKPFPLQPTSQRTLQKLKKPHAIAKRTLQGLGSANLVAGIFSSYYGFIDVSNASGQTSFPRKQSKEVISVVITQKVSPVIMFNNTVSHWELVPGSSAAAYRFELKKDPETNLALWHVESAPVPENRQIQPTDSLLIIAKPKNVFIPIGASFAHPDANLKLPDMYIKPGINTVRNALYMLNMNFLFRPIDLLYKREKSRYGTLIAE
jgi:hypothetical protein